MAALQLLLAAALALQASWAALGTNAYTGPLQGTADNRIPPSRDARYLQCPQNCPREHGQGQRHVSYRGPKLYLTPKTAEVKVTLKTKTSLGHEKSETHTVKSGEIGDFTYPYLVGFGVSGDVWYCEARQGVEPWCLPTTTTTTTTTSTSTSTTTTTTTTGSTSTTTSSATTTSTTNVTATAAPADGYQGLRVFLLILSVALVLLSLLLVARRGLAYRSTLADLNNSIAVATVQAAASHRRWLHALRNAVALDLWLRLCLCMLVVCMCACVYGLYLVCSQDDDLFVALYIPGAVCLLLDGYFCVGKVNSTIRAAVEGQRRPRPATDLHPDEEESTGSESNMCSEGSCASRVIAGVLKVCLLLLLLCLCVLTYGLWHLLQQKGQGQAEEGAESGRQ